MPEFLIQRTLRFQSTLELAKCRRAVSFILWPCSFKLLFSSRWLSPLRLQLSDRPKTAQLVILQSLKSMYQRGAPQQQAEMREASVRESQFIERLMWRSFLELELKKKCCTPQSSIEVWCKSSNCRRVRQVESAMQRRELDVTLRLPQRSRWFSFEKEGLSAIIFTPWSEIQLSARSSRVRDQKCPFDKCRMKTSVTKLKFSETCKVLSWRRFLHFCSSSPCQSWMSEFLKMRLSRLPICGCSRRRASWSVCFTLSIRPEDSSLNWQVIFIESGNHKARRRVPLAPTSIPAVLTQIRCSLRAPSKSLQEWSRCSPQIQSMCSQGSSGLMKRPVSFSRGKAAKQTSSFAQKLGSKLIRLRGSCTCSLLRETILLCRVQKKSAKTQRTNESRLRGGVSKVRRKSSRRVE